MDPQAAKRCGQQTLGQQARIRVEQAPMQAASSLSWPSADKKEEILGQITGGYSLQEAMTSDMQWGLAAPATDTVRELFIIRI